VLCGALKESSSLAKTAPAQIKRAYGYARITAELHGEGRWSAKCPWPTLEALRRAVRARDREYLALEQKGRTSVASCAAPHRSRRVTMGVEDLRVRITIEIDDKLLKEALALTKAKTKKEVIHRSLEVLIRQQRIERLLGKLGRFPLQLTARSLTKLRAND